MVKLFGLRSILVAVVLIAYQVLPASQILLDTLVERGVLTEDEALYAKKQSSVIVESITPQSKVRLMQFWHLRFQTLDQNYSNADDVYKYNFALRRIIPVFIADVSQNSRVMITLYLPSSSVINTARYEHNVDTDFLCGSLWAGYEAVWFCMEENESGTQIKTPDRSIINMYFGGGDHGYLGGQTRSYSTAEAFSGYHAGLFWNGKFVKNKKLIYRLAFTNSKPENIDFDGSNSFALWGSLGVDDKSEDFHLRAGVNAGYSHRVVSASRQAMLPSTVGDYGNCFGINPYFWLTYGNFTIQSEFVATSLKYGSSISNDRPLYTVDSPRANPWGFYFLGAYKFNVNPFGALEPVVRYSFINSDGRGITENVVFYKAESRGGLYNKVSSFYAGVNWYVLGNALKYQFGAEYAMFRDGVVGGISKEADTFMFIAQVQIIL